MLQHADGSVLKPVQPPPRGQRELAFYKKLFEPSCDDPVLMTLRPFLPKFLGIWTPQITLTDCSKISRCRKYNIFRLKYHRQKLLNRSWDFLKLTNASFNFLDNLLVPKFFQNNFEKELHL